MKLLVMISLLTTLTISPALFAAERSHDWISMDRYQVNAINGIVDLVEHSGWGFASCPQARHARLNPSTMTGFEQTFSSVMLAYSNKLKIIINADCASTNSDIAIIQSILLETDTTEE